MNLKLMNLARAGNGVKRFHTISNVLTPETVGHHTAGVIGILFCLYEQNPPPRLIEAALYHDSPEYVTGDNPATAKWDFPNLAAVLDEVEKEVHKAVGLKTKLYEVEEYVLKFADMMDLVFKTHSEFICGNAEMRPIMYNGIQYLVNLVNENLKEFPNAKIMLATFMGEAELFAPGEAPHVGE